MKVLLLISGVVLTLSCTTPAARSSASTSWSFIGGNYTTAGATSFVDLDTVDAAAILPDGSLGPWKNAGETPSAVNSCTATGSGSTLLIVDGIFKTDTDGSQVWSAQFDTGGTLAPWTSLAPLPATRRVLYSQAWVSKGTLFAMDSKLPTDGDVVATLHASFDGKALGAWTEDDWLPGFRGHPELAATSQSKRFYGTTGCRASPRLFASQVSGLSRGVSAPPTAHRYLCRHDYRNDGAHPLEVDPGHHAAALRRSVPSPRRCSPTPKRGCRRRSFA